MKIKKLREWINIAVTKQPARAILIAILLLNILLFAVSALVISSLAPETTAETGFWPSVFYTISMILDAGCIQYVVADIGQTGVGLIIVCMLIVVIGMITFTGAVIGYVTNYISGFIERADSGARALKVSGHTVILNWNTRASEIINDLLYSGEREIIVVVVSSGGSAVKKEIDDRISGTIKQEQESLKKECAGMGIFRRLGYKKMHKVRNRLSVIVREGDTYSLKQLNDASIAQAKTVIILGGEMHNSVCKFDYSERREQLEKGNSNTIKTLVQVAEITSGDDSADGQVIIVEVEDEWTLNLVTRIAAHKERLQKCNIIPVPVNRILGQILSQFSIMPELNTVYSELFSNKGAEFFCTLKPEAKDETKLIRDYMETHTHGIPMTVMDTKTGRYVFYIADRESDVEKRSIPAKSDYSVDVEPDYWLKQKNIIIVGHNSKSEDIMNGFNAFRGEWNRGDGSEILNIIVIDDEKSLEKHGYYKKYPYVNNVIAADVFDSEAICGSINEFIDSNEDETSILILSDDTAANEDIDASVLTYLIYVQNIIFDRMAANPDFDRHSIDVVVEIINPKNYDVVHNYSVDNVVISNRYISKMVTQISRKEALYEFYRDILTYDEENSEVYSSKELYIKEVERFFRSVPGECTAAELIRAVFSAMPDDNRGIVIGYVDAGGDTHLFSGNQEDIRVRLGKKDKLIIFGCH